jgi:ribosomal protein L29
LLDKEKEIEKLASDLDDLKQELAELLKKYEESQK